jgi:hypothetical protein
MREPKDALDVVGFQDECIEQLIRTWRDADRRLDEEGGVDPRWDRGSAIKLLLMHIAVREAARVAVARRLRDAGEGALAEAFEEGGPERRAAIGRLEEQLRGIWAIEISQRPLIDAAEEVVEIWRGEVERERTCLLPEAAAALGASGRRGLPSARSIRAQSTIHPRSRPRWYDAIPPIKAARACYQYWRNTMGDTLSPAVGAFEDHTPGVR